MRTIFVALDWLIVHSRITAIVEMFKANEIRYLCFCEMSFDTLDTVQVRLNCELFLAIPGRP